MEVNKYKNKLPITHTIYIDYIVNSYSLDNNNIIKCNN